MVLTASLRATWSSEPPPLMGPVMAAEQPRLPVQVFQRVAGWRTFLRRVLPSVHWVPPTVKHQRNG